MEAYMAGLIICDIVIGACMFIIKMTVDKDSIFLRFLYRLMLAIFLLITVGIFMFMLEITTRYVQFGK